MKVIKVLLFVLLIPFISFGQSFFSSPSSYEVAVHEMQITDSSRNEKLSPDETDFRQVKFRIWYPVKASSKNTKAEYFPELDKIEAALKAKGDTASPILKDLKHAREINIKAYKNGELIKSIKTPLIVFSSGGNVSENSYSAFAQEFSGKGCVVVVISHPYSSLGYFDKLGFLMSSPYWKGLNDTSAVISDAFDNELSDLLAEDANLVVENFKNSQNSILKKLRPIIDFNKVVIAGHSRGGKTVARACNDYPVFKAGIVFDNLAPARERLTGIDQPLLFIRTQWAAERTANLESYLNKNKSFALDAVFEKANHFSFTDFGVFHFPGYEAKLDPNECFKQSNMLVDLFLDVVFNKKDISSLRNKTFSDAQIKLYGL